MKYCESDQNATNKWQSHSLYNIHGFQFITIIMIILKIWNIAKWIFSDVTW